MINSETQAEAYTFKPFEKISSFKRKEFETDVVPAGSKRFLSSSSFEAVLVRPDGRTVRCRYDSLMDKSIPSDSPFPVNHYYFYFEVLVVSLSSNRIGIGITGDNYKFCNKIGDSKGSCGYTSNGMLRHNGAPMRPRQAKWESGDVIGCGIVHFAETVFFTRNGELVEHFFDGVDDAKYAVMMFGGMGDEMKFLEEKEFKFDVDNFIRDHIVQSKIIPPLDIKDNLMNDFIKHYLLCEGYEKTYNAITKKPAKADQEISALLTVESDSERSAVRKVIESLPIRKQIIKLILNGDSNKTVSIIEQHFGSLDNEIANFVLLSQIFLEFLRVGQTTEAFAVISEKLTHFLTDPSYGRKYEEPLRSVTSALALSEPGLKAHPSFSRKHRQKVAEEINAAILAKIYQKVAEGCREPLGLLFKHILAVDALCRAEKNFLGLPLSLKDY